jgi:hypothetical protein
MDVPDVICINCEHLIPLKDISSHSSFCLQPKPHFQNSSKIPEINLINLKLKRLSKGLERLTSSLSSSYEKEAIKFLIETSQKLSNQAEISKNTLTTTLSFLNTLKNYSFIDSPFIFLVIYSERLKYCMKDKIKLLNSLLTSEKRIITQNIKELLENNDKTLSELEKELQDQKNLKNELEKSMEKISVINSSLDLSCTSRSFHSRHSSIGSLSSLSDFEVTKNSQTTETQNRKVFYSKCLTAKLKFSSKDPAQLVQLSDLYIEAKAKNVCIEKWNDFIMKQLQNPVKWISSTKGF